MAIFRPKNWVFGQQNEICGQNATRDLFLYHQMGAACKIWANSIGSFPRSGVDWKKRLKLIFEKGLGLGALPRPRKLRWTVGADHLDVHGWSKRPGGGGELENWSYFVVWRRGEFYFRCSKNSSLFLFPIEFFSVKTQSDCTSSTPKRPVCDQQPICVPQARKWCLR